MRAVNESHGWGGIKQGDIGKITSCIGKEDGKYKYYADFPNQTRWAGFEHCFQLVESGVVSVSEKYIAGVDPYESREKEHPYIKDVEAIDVQLVKPKKIKRLTI